MCRCLTSHLQVSDPTKLDHSSFHKNYWSRFVTHWKWVAFEEKTRKSVKVCVCVCVCVWEREIVCPLLKPISYSLRRQQIRQKTDIFRHSITERAVCVCVCVCVWHAQCPTHGHTASYTCSIQRVLTHKNAFIYAFAFTLHHAYTQNRQKHNYTTYSFITSILLSINTLIYTCITVINMIYRSAKEEHTSCPPLMSWVCTCVCVFTLTKA